RTKFWHINGPPPKPAPGPMRIPNESGFRGLRPSANPVTAPNPTPAYPNRPLVVLLKSLLSAVSSARPIPTAPENPFSRGAHFRGTLVYEAQRLSTKAWVGAPRHE